MITDIFLFILSPATWVKLGRWFACSLFHPATWKKAKRRGYATNRSCKCGRKWTEYRRVEHY